MFGLEAIFRNGVLVGHLRRSDFGFYINKTLGYGYIRNPDGGVVRVFNATSPCLLTVWDFNQQLLWGFLKILSEIKKMLTWNAYQIWLKLNRLEFQENVVDWMDVFITLNNTHASFIFTMMFKI